jgi:hypothetical protein
MAVEEQNNSDGDEGNKKNTFSWQITQAYIFHGNEGRAIAFDGNEQIHSKPNHTTLPLEDDGST